ncbi:signal peptide peptidase SppA [Parvibaculum sp.]|uniref:signal peptide peptidase SppA n=1 Tax=Parvibaculum sp. TaxID=2024848 RepID=UPI000C3AF05F|nr:signal peptide peptidase SppA [Parvibaculum sp.]HAC58093.1 signal peptide peptidase SppA [Rhodobiaceae bacterium]MAU61585.1 signal peptide peptidase SppA [Parvibaculum sp.]MBO6668142.1 signal peptide peptidase SppA [Parvibaculum sp.]MBO6693558.1 signal peptide peptidase SppA [Parvibaculum sp.]MBO6714740.1 signal peptide peptidase SppA [Parvibaculum sp.]
MSLDADTLADRRRLKRRLFLWRAGAIVAVLAALIVLVAEDGSLLPGAQIARVSVTGIIVDDRAQQEMLEKIAKDDHVKAVILSIDSPGGTTTGAEALFASVRQVAEEKPVVAVLGTVAASGGYIAAISADHIVARGNTITGSIGVLFQWTQIEELLDSIGVEMKEVKSAPLKAEPNPFHKTSPEAIRATQAMLDTSYAWFLRLVSERRGMDETRTRELGDGRVYTGWQAIENGLIDQVGGEEEALAWLESEHGIQRDLPVKDWEPVYPELGMAGFAGQALGEAALTTIEGLSGKTLQTKRLTLDGLTSLWQPAL